MGGLLTRGMYRSGNGGGSIVAVDVTAAGSSELWLHQSLREGQPLLRSPGRVASVASGDTSAAMAAGVRRKAGEV